MKKVLLQSLFMLLIFLAFVVIHSYLLEYIQWSLLFIFIAGFLDAVKDTLAHHFTTSIFKKLKPSFWDASVSWQGGKVLGIMRMDGWHIAKMLHTLFICLAIVSFKVSTIYLPVTQFQSLAIDFLFVYCSYKAAFNIGYSKILISK